MQYIPCNSKSGNSKPSVSIITEEIAKELNRWNNAIVGYVIGARSPFKLMKQFVERRWKAFGHTELFILRAGVFIFNFQNEAKMKLLDMGPWSYYDKPLILKSWSPSQSYDNPNLDKIPIWVRLPQLKLHLWSAKTPSKLASQIGQPLLTDQMTAMRQWLAYARVCIEVDKLSSFPHSIEINDHDGSSYQQHVEYEWLQAICEMCKQIGHKSTLCPKIKKWQWRPVTKTQVDNVESLHELNNKKKGEDQALNQSPTRETSAGDRVACKAIIELIDHGANNTPSAPKDIILNNKFSSLECSADQNCLAILPLAIESPSSTPLNDPCQLQGEFCIQRPNPMETISTESSSISPISNLNEAQIFDGVQASCSIDSEWSLSKSQKKKRGKILHALLHKNKGNRAISPDQPS